MYAGTHRRVHACLYVCVYVRLRVCVYGRTDGWMDARIYKSSWMDGCPHLQVQQVHVCVCGPLLPVGHRVFATIGRAKVSSACALSHANEAMEHRWKGM